MKEDPAFQSEHGPVPFRRSAVREPASEEKVAYETLGSNRKSLTTQPHTHTHTRDGLFPLLEKKTKGKQKQSKKQKAWSVKCWMDEWQPSVNPLRVS